MDTSNSGSSRLVLLYHFFHPDEVISARLFSDLAEVIAEGHDEVVAMPCVRPFANADSSGPTSLPKKELWNEVTIHRVWRPALRQSSNLGRILNASAMLCAWSWRALVMKRVRNETMIVGTDPILSVLVALPWRILRRKSRIIHWCHDLHPEASIAEGSLKRNAWYVRLLRWWLSKAYQRCDVIVDLGPCMRAALQSDACVSSSRSSQLFTTITPWALVEPAEVPVPEPSVRQELFGQCKLGCLYSGNLGRAHEFNLFLELARASREQSLSVCFAGRGARFKELERALLPSDTNVHLADFAAEDQLAARLAAGDIHLVSLREEWTGTVVPSKFFGSIAMGRPVLFLGSPHCAIARWIEEYGLGWNLRRDNLQQILVELELLAEEPVRLRQLQAHCQQIYQQHFSKAKQLAHWRQVLKTSAVVATSLTN